MSDPAHPLTALVLAGGRARRLGGLKAERELGGRRLVDHVLALARGVSDDVLLLDRGRGVPAHDVRRVDDWFDLEGPLAGLGAGLAAARHDWCLLLPCDLPFLVVPVVDRLRSHARPGDRAVLIETDGRLQPFPGLLRSDLAADLAAHTARGGRSLTGFLEGVAPRRIAAEDFAELDPGLRFLVDVDTPQDLDRARGVETA